MSLFNHKDGDLLLEQIRETPVDFTEMALDRAHEITKNRHAAAEESHFDDVNALASDQ